MKHFHPRKGDHGQPVELNAPSQPTAPSSWIDPNEIATVTPDGPCPLTLNGIAFADWDAARARRVSSFLRPIAGCGSFLQATPLAAT